MKRAKRILLIASVLVLSVGSASASWWHRTTKKDASQTAVTPAAATAITLDAIESGPSQIVLRTSGAPAFTSISPTPTQFVVDLSGTAKAATLAVPSQLPKGVAAITTDQVTELDALLTRVTIQLAQPGIAQAAAEGNSVVISLPAPVPSVAEVKPAVEPPPSLSAVPAQAVPEKVTEPVVKTEALHLPKARFLKRIETSGSGSSIEVRIATDGDASYSAFKLEAPFRVVIDLAGVQDKISKKAIAVSDGPVKQIRAAQYSKDITRVVLDLSEKTAYDVTKNGDRIVVTFGNAAAAAAVAPAPLKVAVMAAPAADSPKPSADVPKAEPAKAAPPTDVVAQVPAVAENASTWKMPEDDTRGAVSVISGQSQVPPPPPAPATTTTTAKATSESVFSEPQPAATPMVGGQLGGSRTLSPGEKIYTGEPISLNLKDADIKDVLRTFGQLTGLNMAIDPNVTGSVTVDFVDVPWDQALDLILRQNHLGYTLEGNVMRVGTLGTLAEEAAANRRLQEEERLNVPLTTVSFKLSYARANDVQGLLKDIASPRAKIIVDGRTNQLIISEIPAYLTTIRNLIESVDVPNRQVVIEARIVTASNVFIQSYGFNWSFRGTLDPSLGTGTGLVFPSSVDTIGGPFAFGVGNPVLSFGLSNVLGSFSLDMALVAAESQGFARVISAPRVQTQDNVPASIESGIQVPVQTRINFTTTVNYIPATLNLSVTPQITEAGTIIMDIAVSKNDVGTTTAGAPGPQISTNSAHTKLMVRDGGTTVIGGIYTVNSVNNQSRLPFVHQIPILGWLFKTHDLSDTRTELLIFITPRIVRTT